jgi:Zn-dependent peptidase ImmA (M78 family)
MLKQIIEAARLSPEFCASLIRVPPEQFREWVDGKRPLPHFVIPELSTILGVSKKDLTARGPGRGSGDSAVAPAIWFKLRDEKLGQADREFVGLVRRLGFFISQLETIRGIRSSSAWRAVAQTVAAEVDRAAPPAMQGRDAALRFRSAANLEHGQSGIGEIIRPRLRQIGLAVIESPIPKSSLEGCCFAVGAEGNLGPCVFANTFKSTWFRRNEILLHEVCHAIFDLENDPVSLDFLDQTEDLSILSEARAHAFAQEALVPRSVLVHFTNQMGLNWACLTEHQLAGLLAEVHVEQKTLLEAAYDNGLIDEEQLVKYIKYGCATALRELSPHAWTTREFLRRQANESPKWVVENRHTTAGSRTLRLPAGYVKQVIDAANDGDISIGKAAELLMMDRYTFADRFGDIVVQPSLA